MSGTKKPMTALSIKNLKPDESASDPSPRGAGVLQARKLSNGSVAFYFRYTNSKGVRDRLSVGLDSTLQEARKRAAVLSRRYQDGDRDLRDALVAEALEVKREVEAAEARLESQRAKLAATLGALVHAYCDFLEARKKVSAPKVRQALLKHVRDASPALWSKPAIDLDVEDLAFLIRPLVHKGRLREAAKIRSYLQAAYASAVSARQGINGSQSLRELQISRNPAKDLATVESAGTMRQRALSESELRAYWQVISAMPNPGGALLRFHLLTGCQRIEQLARVETTDVDADRPSMKIYDAKGRRKAPRSHEVPLIPAAIKAMEDMDVCLGTFVASIDHGTSGAAYASYRHRLKEVTRILLEKGKLPGGVFAVGDLRRTVETRLAAVGVSGEVRAQLQSHGLGGVQARHYDRHEYFSEKLGALEKLFRIIVG